MEKRDLLKRAVFIFACLGVAACSAQTATSALSLDGVWRLTTDPENRGREQAWFSRAALEGARPAQVPWILQDAFPEYHGVVWYQRAFKAPVNPHAKGRYLLRFWQVDYLAEVWLNGRPVGGHEGGETPFVLDVTGAVKPGAENLLTVRVLNPTQTPVDGIVLSQTARRCKTENFEAGAFINHGGITDSVELLCVPSVYGESLFVTATAAPGSGVIRVQAEVRNASEAGASGTVEISVAPARDGETAVLRRLTRDFPKGMTRLDESLDIPAPVLWEPGAPYLYRVTVRVQTGGAACSELSTRCGFRDFRFTDGYFRFNGRRLYLKSAHTCNHFPMGLQLPRDPDLLRRDLLNLKVMGFNMVRFIWGGATRAQLDLCDEIGLLVYEESYAAVPLELSPQMGARFDAAVSELIRRDRNHPSVVIWGLLNETRDTPVFRHAAAMLPLVRSLDPTRLVMLNSGRWDEWDKDLSVGERGVIGGVAGFKMWSRAASSEPWVAVSPAADTVRTVGITWPSGALALHPGPANEFSVVRWTAPAAGEIEVAATFTGLAQPTTTDVHVLHNGRSLFDGSLNMGGANEAVFKQRLAVVQGETLDFVVGSGNGHYAGDTTGLALAIRAAGRVYDAAAEFTETQNGGVWSYGWMAPSAQPVAAAFTPYPADARRAAGEPAVGTLSNPGSEQWEDSLGDFHGYPRSPHLAGDIQMLRTRDGGKGRPLFLSEYGVGSAVDLWRAVRHFEQEGATRLEDARYFRDKLDRFMADWKQWRLEEAFDRPEDFFMESLKKMAGQRTLGMNAIRANPRIVAYNLTGAIDHVMCGEGLTTLFREMKPGTVDALYDAWYPLRWCLFAEPAHVARGGKVRLEAVLADEGVLAPGEYPVRVQVTGPGRTRVLERSLTVTVSAAADRREQPFAKGWFAEDVMIDGPAGEYKFLVSFERGAAAAGGRASFHVSDGAALPPVRNEIVLWGADPEVARWLTERGIRHRPFSAAPSGKREVILCCTQPQSPGGAPAFRELARKVAAGSCAIFLAPEVFVRGDQSAGWLPLVNKGAVMPITPSWGGLYLKDEWNKKHPVFAGLPAGGLMDYSYYRDILPDLVFVGQNPPEEAVAGAIKASQGYASGLTVAVYALGQGRFLLNSLRLRENLFAHPPAGAILANMLLHAGQGLSRPEAALPEGFEKQLDEFGY